MDTTTEAQIYLADQRGYSRTPAFQSFHTFNFGAYRAEGREPFGSLCLLNDDSLRAGASLTLQVAENTQVLLLPVNGGLEYQCDPSAQLPNNGTSATDAGTPAAGVPAAGFLETGQAGLFYLKAGTRYTVSNPYEQETIDFLQIWLTSSAHPFLPSIRVIDIDLSVPNTLVSLKGDAPREVGRIYIGQFEGRQDGLFALNSVETGVYGFVVHGAFEVANRLLHEKDGLSLRNSQDGQVEFEALSNGAVLLMLTV